MVGPEAVAARASVQTMLRKFQTFEAPVAIPARVPSVPGKDSAVANMISDLNDLARHRFEGGLFLMAQSSQGHMAFLFGATLARDLSSRLTSCTTSTSRAPGMLAFQISPFSNASDHMLHMIRHQCR
eukprot:7774104-Alexandrium_andersonii.AAC.1